MKIIHTGDIHLGSKMDSKFPKDIAKRRKEELRNTFRRLVDYACANGVRAIILAGDVFDSDTPTLRDKEFFYSVVRNTPAVDFLYLKGNHDICAYAEEQLPNLKTFGPQWRYYKYDNLLIAGAESCLQNAASLYSTLELPPQGLNVAVLHGQAGDVAGKDMVCLKKLRDKNIDYLALGHVHKPQSGRLDGRGEYAYCGCLEGRGFDEIGARGFILLEVGASITRKFIPFAERTFYEESVDVGGLRDSYAAFLRIKERVNFNKRDIYRVNLVGQVEAEADISASDVATYLQQQCFFADVKNRTEQKFDWQSFAGDLSLRGEFVRTVINCQDLTQEEKNRVAAIGLKALKGGEIDL